jgi:hypothetical protein
MSSGTSGTSGYNYLAWTEHATDATSGQNTGNIATECFINITLPSVTSVGVECRFIGFGPQSDCWYRIQAPSGKKIYFGDSETASGGYIQSTAAFARDAAALISVNSNGDWIVTSAVGTWIVN